MKVEFSPSFKPVYYKAFGSFFAWKQPFFRNTCVRIFGETFENVEKLKAQKSKNVQQQQHKLIHDERR